MPSHFPHETAKGLIYYGGSPTVHLGWKRSASLCLARLREDGFAAYESVDTTRPAILTTSPLRKSDKAITLTADGDVSFEMMNTDDGNIRLKLTLAPASKLYALNGVELVNTSLPAPKLAPLPGIPVQRGALSFTFDTDAEGWEGVEKVAHHPGGYITVSREKNLRPFAHGQPLPGDWPSILGGDEVTISARLRAPKPGGAIRLEIFARDIAQWTFEKLPPFTTEWRTMETTIRYDWTDAQAKAAGWIPSGQAYSWRETLQHAGKIVIMAAQSGSQESFDLDDINIEAK